MDIKRAGSQPSGKGPSDWFTGTVRLDPLFQAPAPARVGGASVTFEPGARTHCLAHPSARSDSDRHGWMRLGAARRRPNRGNPPRRCRVVPPRREALAWRHAENGNDTHRHSGSAGWQTSGLVGEGERRSIPKMSFRATSDLIFSAACHFQHRSLNLTRWARIATLIAQGFPPKSIALILVTCNFRHAARHCWT
jgi:hypothetical protein